MAAANPTITRLADGAALKIVWTLDATDTTGVPMELTQYPHRTVYFLGTWDTATAALQGGDNTTWLSLTDPQGNAISKTADAIEKVTEMPQYVRPAITAAGGGSEEITVTVIAHK